MKVPTCLQKQQNTQQQQQQQQQQQRYQLWKMRCNFGVHSFKVSLEQGEGAHLHPAHEPQAFRAGTTALSDPVHAHKDGGKMPDTRIPAAAAAAAAAPPAPAAAVSTCCRLQDTSLCKQRIPLRPCVQVGSCGSNRRNDAGGHPNTQAMVIAANLPFSPIFNSLHASLDLAPTCTPPQPTTHYQPHQHRVTYAVCGLQAPHVRH